MYSIAKKLPFIAVLAGICVLIFSATVAAHVVVKPSEVTTAAFQTFTVGVPNEKDMLTTTVKLEMPAGLEHVSPTQKPGWEINIERAEDTAVNAITWSGGEIGVGLRDDFTFSAKVPGEATELQWKAYQTYADGTVVAWDQGDTDSSHSGGDSGPFSVTNVVAESAQEQAVEDADQSAADAEKTARRALYVAIAGVVVGLIGIALSTRKD